MSARGLPGWLLVAAATHGPTAALADTPRPARLTSTGAVYLRPLSVELGSTDAEVLSALVRCKREPLPDRCDETTFVSETPTHEETVEGFWIARNEVTVAEYERCVGAGRCAPPAYGGGGQRFQKPRFPVTLVTFDDARRYCAFRGGRLPTEAEFERAARGPGRRVYPWGNAWHTRVVNHGRSGVDATDASDGFAELAPVGSFPDGATPEGVLDLAGNVEEWTADLYAPTRGVPPGPERVVRGGSYESAAPFVRGAARSGMPPETRAPTLGFRCVWRVKPVRD
jgi:formylglycine-generating enzyme